MEIAYNKHTLSISVISRAYENCQDIFERSPLACSRCVLMNYLVM